MSDSGVVINQFVAWVRALLPDDWRDRAGQRFRKTSVAVSQFAEENHVRPSELVSLGRRKLEGLGNKEFAAMIKDFADAEGMKIETELKRRSLESEVRKKEAEAREAEIRVLRSEIELVRQLKEIGVIVRADEHGGLTVLPAPKDLDFSKLEDRLLGDKGA